MGRSQQFERRTLFRLRGLPRYVTEDAESLAAGRYIFWLRSWRLPTELGRVASGPI